MENKNVAVMGASPNPERYANIAIRMLKSYGYTVFPINPAFENIEGFKCYKKIGDVPEPIDTVTMYMSAKNSAPVANEILAVKPRRIIFNPGAENYALGEKARENNILVEEDCTLVMLRSGQF